MPLSTAPTLALLLPTSTVGMVCFCNAYCTDFECCYLTLPPGYKVHARANPTASPSKGSSPARSPAQHLHLSLPSCPALHDSSR